MSKLVFDPLGSVESAGGIPKYIEPYDPIVFGIDDFENVSGDLEYARVVFYRLRDFLYVHGKITLKNAANKIVLTGVRSDRYWEPYRGSHPLCATIPSTNGVPDAYPRATISLLRSTDYTAFNITIEFPPDYQSFGQTFWALIAPDLYIDFD